MNIEDFKSKAKLLRSNDIYNVYDLKELDNLTLSLTELHPLQNTTGHLHKGADEVYIFISGIGTIEIDKESLRCEKGDIFTIPGGAFHKVYNTGTEDLKFWCVFERYAGR